VLVERGKVRVTWPAGTTLLGAGEQRTFETEDPAAALEPAASPSGAP
jgi:hypothetical protein